jgi:hypothetical protein
MSAHFMLAQPNVVEHLGATARDALAERFDAYAGPSASHLKESGDEMTLFGWKDPRSTFTLPVWEAGVSEPARPPHRSSRRRRRRESRAPAC